MNKNLGKRALSILLCMVMLFTYLPAGILTRAKAAGEESGILASQLTADPSTLHAWKDTAFNPYNLTTEHAGGVWTDKSVLKKEDIATAFPNVAGLSVADNNFLVALSALGANSMIVGKDVTATDVIFVLDISLSMSSEAINEMISATNDSIHTLLTTNQSNRVGVVVYAASATTLLPLDRYTPVTDNGTVEYIERSGSGSSYFGSSGTIRPARVGSGTSARYVQNSAGQNMSASGVSVSSGTYIQGGLWRAWEQFESAAVSGKRTPVLVLMSDGAPSNATEDFTDVPNTSDIGSGNPTYDTTPGMAFITQLSAVYVKNKITEKYGTAYFYTLGLGVGGMGSVTVAEAVLDTSRPMQEVEAFWTEYSGLASSSAKTMNVPVRTNSNTSATITYSNAVSSANKNYVNRYFSAENASQLSEAFKGVVNEISLKAGYNVTRIEGADANTGGFVTFVDEIGTGMQVKDIKGILIGEKLYTGAQLVRAMKNGEFGTIEASTSLGDNLVWALEERLRIQDTANQTAAERVWELLDKAWTAGQLSYSNENDWSNYIGWFGNANGEYIGFWDVDDPDPVIPEGAVYANICYAMLGATTESQTAHASDMMYVAIQISKPITNGKVEAKSSQTVTFRVPASLLPTVTYQIEVEAGEGEEITEQTPAKLTYNDAEPIRLLYEVGVHSELTPLNIKEFLRDGYPAKDENGNYYLYTNAWQWDGATVNNWSDPTSHPDKGSEVLYDTGKNRITYAYFEPSEQNEHYYFTEDTILYTYNGTAYEKVTTAPVDGVQYYFQHKTFTANAAQIGVEVTAKVDVHYGKVEAKALAHAVQGDDGVYYIKEGTMHYGTIHDHDKLKTDNATGSFKYRMHQLVDIPVNGEGVATHNYEIMYLGNNGRITYAPAQGL